jgi:hypothetical protein
VLRYAVEVRFGGYWWLLHRAVPGWPAGPVPKLRRCRAAKDEAQGSPVSQWTLKDPAAPWCRQVVLPRAARLLGMLEPALERVVYQDIPANLLALKHRVETRRAALKVAELEQQGAPSRFRAALLASSQAVLCCCSGLQPGHAVSAPVPCTHPGRLDLGKAPSVVGAGDSSTTDRRLVPESAGSHAGADTVSTRAIPASVEVLMLPCSLLWRACQPTDVNVTLQASTRGRSTGGGRWSGPAPTR